MYLRNLKTTLWGNCGNKMKREKRTGKENGNENPFYPDRITYYSEKVKEINWKKYIDENAKLQKFGRG